MALNKIKDMMETNKVSREMHPSPFDITVKVEDLKIRAHRNVLRDGSEYFRSLLYGSFKEASDSEINLTKVTSNFAVLEKVVDFMYTREIDLNDENISEIVKLASYFLMENLQKVCEDYLLNRLKKDTCLNYYVLGLTCGLTNLQKVCEQFMLDTVNKDTCLNYYILGVDHGLKTVEEKSGIVLESRLHDYLITRDTMLTLLPSELKLIASKGFFKNCSLPNIICFLSKWVEQGQSQQHVSVASEMLENYVTDTDTKVKFGNALKLHWESAVKTLETCNLKPELCRKVEECVRENAGPLPQDLEDAVLTISPRKNVVDKCIENLKTEDSFPNIHEKFKEDILDLCLYVPARKQWFHLKSLEDDDGINAKLLRKLHCGGYGSGELYVGRFTLFKNFLFIAFQNSYAPIHVFDMRDFSVRKIPFFHVFDEKLQKCAFEGTYDYETSEILFADIWLTVGEGTLYMSLVLRKPVFGVSDLVRHKPGCTVTEGG